MGTKIIDVQMLKHHVDGTPTAEQADKVQVGAFMSVIDAFDRKLERQAFIDLLSAAMGLHSNLAKLVILRSMSHLHGEGNLNTKAFEDADTGLESYIKAGHSALVKQVNLMVQCAGEEDRVH